MHKRAVSPARHNFRLYLQCNQAAHTAGTQQYYHLAVSSRIGLLPLCSPHPRTRTKNINITSDTKSYAKAGLIRLSVLIHIYIYFLRGLFMVVVATPTSSHPLLLPDAPSQPIKRKNENKMFRFAEYVSPFGLSQTFWYYCLQQMAQHRLHNTDAHRLHGPGCIGQIAQQRLHSKDRIGNAAKSGLYSLNCIMAKDG